MAQNEWLTRTPGGRCLQPLYYGISVETSSSVPREAACLDAVMGFENRPPVHAAEQHPLEPAVERFIAPARRGMKKRE